MRRVWIPQLIAGLMLLWALNPENPYAYYVLLRWVCCAAFAYLAFQALAQGKRDWVWVGDTVEGIMSLLDAPDDKVIGEVFNLGTGISTSVLELAEIISNLMGKPKKLNFMTERFGQVQNHISSTEKLFSATGFKAKMPLNEGLKRTIEWYDMNKEWWKNQIWLKKVPVRLKKNKIIYW